MALIETLIAGIGAAVAKATLKLWLKDHEIAASTGSSITDILAKKIPELFARNKTKRTFEDIRDLSASSIQKLLLQEAKDASEQRLEVVSNAAAEVLQNTPIDIDLLVAHNLDKESLVEFFLNRTGADGGNPALAGKGPDNSLFPEAEQHIYRRILSHASQLIVDMSSNFPRFEESVNGELLKRTASMAEEVIEGMNRVVEQQGDAFESDYRNACVRKWDHLELFGVDLQESNKRYNLSVAYVTLMVERLQARSNRESQTDPDDDQSDSRDSMPADEALASYSRLFVRGPAGSGKTTLLQWFAVFAAARKLEGQLSEFNGCVPFLIKLRHYSEDELPAPENFPKDAAKAISGRMPEAWVHDRLTSGKALVLVDGLDEVPERRRTEVKEWLNELTSSFPEARFVVTSRPHAAKEGWLCKDDFVDAELQDMSRPDIHEFIDHWHQAVAESTQEKEERDALAELSITLKEKLTRNAAIYRLANSPLLCAMLCALHRQRVKNLPSDRIELYQLCIDMFFRRDIERGIDGRDYIQLSTRQMESLLQDFAWWMIRNEKTTATPDEVVAHFNRHYQRLQHVPEDRSGQDVLELFLQRIGIVRQLAHRKIDFPHRTFQEFLAAKAAVAEDDLGELVKSAHDDQWREVVVLAAGMLSSGKASELIEALLKRGDEEEAFRNTLYLVAVSALDVLIVGLADSEFEDRVFERLQAVVPPQNLTAAKELASAGDLVVPYLDNFDGIFARDAVNSMRTLTMIGTEAAIEQLASYVDNHAISVQKELTRFFLNEQLPSEHAPQMLRNVRYLNFTGWASIPNLWPLRHCVQLRDLDLFCSTTVSDLTPLGQCLNLQALNVGYTWVVDLRPLASCLRLWSLNLEGTAVEDLSPLWQCKNLRSLNLIDTPVSRLEILALKDHLPQLSVTES